MLLFAWVLVGVVVGWAVGKALQGNSYGSARDVSMGVGGSLAGGFLMSSAAVRGYPGVILSTFVAMICAALLASLVAMANGRRALARQL